MKTSRREFIKQAGVFGLVLSFPDWHTRRSGKLLRVLIIGDSISVGYTPHVKEMMKDEAYVEHPVENCQGTKFGLQKIDKWIGTEPWDVIHFNFGLHDLKHVDPVTRVNSEKAEDPQQSNIKEYKENLEVIVKKLKTSGAKLIWATTTPYPDKPSGPYRNAADVLEYNKVALKIMKKNRIPVNDLYSYILPDMSAMQLPNNVHFKKEGSEALARKVVAAIKEQVAKGS
ncbi:hypothetical protein DYBT9275_02387 [Dyadobacter sp. CECT 9275]|uniref:SGNH hydrolase-type esterase domain-containing protein n=1 Tax=Dyadobacter helix TaxID=2822344 RepID=A0A916N5V5_9BACT|nr:SGNH/GDSL hydrolase family protein [Dyadobacter sp. CECT 9275]CAG5000101.1 hypothetical protein DYBT9275_02387 [Dyadobacter sp. CECT 9275]